MNTPTLQNLNKLRRDRILTTCFVALFMCVILFVPAFADGVSDAAAEMGIFKTKINELYSFFLKVVRPVATVALALCALGCLWGGQKDWEKNFGRAKFILIAIAVLYFLPAVIRFGSAIFSGIDSGLPAPAPVPGATHAPIGGLPIPSAAPSP